MCLHDLISCLPVSRVNPATSHLKFYAPETLTYPSPLNRMASLTAVPIYSVCSLQLGHVPATHPPLSSIHLQSLRF